MIPGTRIDSSHGLHLRLSPWDPSMSPWSEGTALLEVEIFTGRPHQIRIHLAYAGHPLVGDPLYGPGGTPLPGTAALPGDPGYLLHAHRLELRHPGHGTWLTLTCQPPPVLRLS